MGGLVWFGNAPYHLHKRTMKQIDVQEYFGVDNMSRKQIMVL